MTLLIIHGGSIRPTFAFSSRVSNHLKCATTRVRVHVATAAAHHHPSRLFSTSSNNIAIVGGGLAGLSTAYHLLSKMDSSSTITIIDKAPPGEGGASAVAGGLLHPFSPKGKLIHLGNQGLQSTNNLLRAASRHRPDCIVRHQLYRLALSTTNVEQLQQTAELYPDLATWLTASQIINECGPITSDDCLGGLRLSNGCKVIHVPTYLQGLWDACAEMSDGRASWSIEDLDLSPPGNDHDSSHAHDEMTMMKRWRERLAKYDAVVFSAGSGLFHDSILGMHATDLPTDLVRGQSIEMSIPRSPPTDDESSSTSTQFPNEAVLCGKYIAPLLDDGRLVIGATHEYKADPLDVPDVIEELKSRSYRLSPFVWDQGVIDRITCGYRVQSQRGAYGRMPIIGQIGRKKEHMDSDVVHHNAWIFTGLSARGLIHHGVYGELLSDAIMDGDDAVLLQQDPNLLWWKR